MKYLMFFTAIVFLTSSCSELNGSGNIIKQKRDIPSFTGVEAGGAFEVEIKKGAVTGVIVESDDNIMPYIKTKVVEGVLEISHKDLLSINSGHFKVYITTPTLNLIKASGASNFKTIDELDNIDKIYIETSGAAKISAIVNAPNIKIKASGASTIEIKGKTKKFTAGASGSASVKCASLLSENADLSASGASTIRAHASVSMVAKASGAANIYHIGTNNIKEKVSGAASITSAD